MALSSGLPNGITATEPADENRSSVSSIEQLLSQESSGVKVDRSSLLQSRDLTDFARWQAGMVQRNGNWLPIESLSGEPGTAALREYAERRAAAQQDADGHRKLAQWCQQHGLDAQAIAHWTAILDMEPNDWEARLRLKHKWINGSWFTPDQLAKADQASDAYLQSLRDYLPQCTSIARSLSKDASDKAKALKRLKDIDDERAIPAFEQMAMQAGDATAAPWIQAIASHQTVAACLALARIALSEPGDRAKLAASKLQNYPREFYVPELLSLLATPIETKVKYGVNEFGEMVVSRAMFRTTDKERQLLELERTVRVNNPIQTQQNISGFFSIGFQRLSQNTSTSVSRKLNSAADINTDEVAAAKSAFEDQAMLDRSIAQANAQNEALSKRIYAVLAEATGENVESTPHAWWDWWRRYNARSLSDKPYNRKRYEQVDQAALTLTNTQSAGVVQLSCLVAGTPVQTSTGLVAIESVQVGDLVLSQDIETGKLDLKPVVRKTLREPEQIYRIVTESGDIRATGGHRWWVSGKGWMMSSQLEAGMLLHNAKSATKIKTIETESEALPTHNLIVEGYHTYFVGPDRVLSFDNVDPIPTARKIPGY